MDENWPVFTEVFARLILGWNSPDASDMAEIFRASHTPESWRTTSRENLPPRFDEFAARVQTPTLILYSLSSEAAGERAREIASEMAKSIVIGYPEIERAAFPDPLGIAALLEFIRTADVNEAAVASGRALVAETSLPRAPDGRGGAGTVTILFVDVVDSTPMTARMGDEAFRAVSRELDRAVRAANPRGRRFSGRGQGAGRRRHGHLRLSEPRDRGSAACNAAAASTPLQLHVGLHAGDVIDEGDNVYGWAVNLASRVCGASAPGEVLVSETVRSLTRGSSGLRFEDRGLHELKGIEEPQRLFAVVGV